MKRFTGSVVGMLVLNAAFSSALAADWYAKDNLQPGHDPSMIRLDDGYALMSTNNHLQLWTSEDAYTWKDNGRTMQAVPSWLTQYAPGMEDVWLRIFTSLMTNTVFITAVLNLISATPPSVIPLPSP